MYAMCVFICYHNIDIFSVNASKEFDEEDSSGSTDMVDSDEDGDMFQPKYHSSMVPKRPRVEKASSKLKDSSLQEAVPKASQEDDIGMLFQMQYNLISY